MKAALTTIFFGILFSMSFSMSSWACGGGETPPGETPHVGDKSATYCDLSDGGLCAYAWFQNEVNTHTKGKFVIRMLTPDEQDVTLTFVGVKMTMADGTIHGPTPLAIDQRMSNVFQINGARYLMPGAWDILVQGETLGKTFEIAIPVFVGK